jgi:hypothetical protein
MPTPLPSTWTTGYVPWPLPWVGHKRRNRLREAARPVVLGALRRLALIPNTHPMKKDLEVMDYGRATLARVEFAVAWNALHPPTPRPFMYSLLHTGYVLRAVGLKPSYLHEVYTALGITHDSSDAALLTGAHLAAVSDFSGFFIKSLTTNSGWRVQDVLAWSSTYNSSHLSDCQDVGFTTKELGDLVRSNEMPNPSQVEMLKAFRMDPPASA